jgi:tetratricopeptide (TPR) repeat protein
MTDPDGMISSDWERRIAELWAAIGDYDPADFCARVQALTAELPPGNAVALFELASANDTTGREPQAAELSRQALAAGLTGQRRRRAVIQLASTLRYLGHADESVALLTAERDAGSDDLDDAVAAFLALALIDTGREREAAALALATLSRHLTRYSRSLANYARALCDGGQKMTGAGTGGPEKGSA